jgi:16S rRNA processing protein RimM
MQLIGKIVKIHGVDGEFVIKHVLKPNTNATLFTCMMIEVWQGSYIPYFVDEIRSTSQDEWICSFEEIIDREEAKKFSQKNIYASPLMDVSNFIKASEKDFINYKIYNQGKEVGTINEMIDSGRQKLFDVSNNEKSFYIPIQEELIEKIDVAKKIIFMKLPDGLLDI